MSWIKVDGYSPNTMRSGCLICGNGEVRHTASGPEPILSSNYQDDWAGTPEICATCIGEAASMLGWVSSATYSSAVAARSKAEAGMADLTVQLTERAATIRTLTTELAGSFVELAGTRTVRQTKITAGSK